MTGPAVSAQREPAPAGQAAVHIMASTALTGATYDIDRGQQLVPS